MNWNLKDIYNTEDDFYNDKKKIENKLSEIETYKGKLGESADNLFNCYKIYFYITFF